MSTWTHVNGIIRVDGVPQLMTNCTKENLEKILGPTVNYDSDEKVWDDCKLPCGSEGSLQYEIIKAGDGLVLWTIPVWGDLRDYDNVNEIKEWFNVITQESDLMIRSAIIEICVEGMEPVIIRFEDG